MFDWVTWSIWFVGFVILVIWIIFPLKETIAIIKAQHEAYKKRMASQAASHDRKGPADDS